MRCASISQPKDVSILITVFSVYTHTITYVAKDKRRHNALRMGGPCSRAQWFICKAQRIKGVPIFFHSLHMPSTPHSYPHSYPIHLPHTHTPSYPHSYPTLIPHTHTPYTYPTLLPPPTHTHTPYTYPTLLPHTHTPHSYPTLIPHTHIPHYQVFRTEHFQRWWCIASL